MPGAVLTVHVVVGGAVTSGDPIVTLEAMKMEHVVVAPFDGRVVSDPQRDFVIKDPALPLDFFRAYDSTMADDGPFGPGWSHSYNVRLVFNCFECTGYSKSHSSK